MAAAKSTEQIRQKYPQGKVTDRINNHGRHKISNKDVDGIVHPVATRVNRDSTARVRVQQKYHQRYKPLLDILASTGKQYHVKLIDGEISITDVD